MKIMNITDSIASTHYTANAYLVTGDRNSNGSINTLVDVGGDPDIISKINNIPADGARKRISQVVLTHDHYDHICMLEKIRELYSPIVCAYSHHIPGVDRVLSDGDILHCGDRDFIVIWAPGHSPDSICLYCPANGTLFTGDNHLHTNAGDPKYFKKYHEVKKYIASLDVSVICPGHGPSIVTEARRLSNAVSLRT